MLPTVIASSVIRSTHQGQSHGGVYLVDLECGKGEQVIDWDSPDIRWEGRGLDRGLRGIAFHGGQILLAASDEIFVYDESFAIVDSFRNPYLLHCHEICVHGDRLFLTSTGYDSVLEFDLRRGAFVEGWCLRYHRDAGKLGFARFDPVSDQGPPPKDTIHINSVCWYDGRLHVGALRLNQLLVIHQDTVQPGPRIPQGTHNARPVAEGVMFNDTAGNRVAITDANGALVESFAIVRYPEEALEMNHLPEDHARQGFGRGLCRHDDLIVGGSSPATIAVYRRGTAEAIQTVNLTLDVRNAIHGLEVWPFG